MLFCGMLMIPIKDSTNQSTMNQSNNVQFLSSRLIRRSANIEWDVNIELRMQRWWLKCAMCTGSYKQEM